jgi:putative FmdB family regulatory protein
MSDSGSFEMAQSTIFRKGSVMPIYEYEHLKTRCSQGKLFEATQSIHDTALTQCPHCGGPVQKLISRINISTPKTNRELRDLGFTKLVKRDDGVYENVTARNGDSRMVIRDKPETLPDLKKTIRD